MCESLSEVRFEKGSKLQLFGLYVFYGCDVLKKIDFPVSVESISTSSSYLFFHGVNLECFSYEGTNDFSSLSYFFDSATNVYVSNKYGPSAFAGKSITERGRTCGVSKEHIEKQKTIQTMKIRRNNVVFLQIMFLIIQS